MRGNKMLKGRATRSKEVLAMGSSRLAECLTRMRDPHAGQGQAAGFSSVAFMRSKDWAMRFWPSAISPSRVSKRDSRWSRSEYVDTLYIAMKKRKRTAMPAITRSMPPMVASTSSRRLVHACNRRRKFCATPAGFARTPPSQNASAASGIACFSGQDLKKRRKLPGIVRAMRRPWGRCRLV